MPLKKRLGAFLRKHSILLSLETATLCWFLLSLIFGSGFNNLAADNVLDLSKSVIEAIGILVGFIISAFFYYITKIDSVLIKIKFKRDYLNDIIQKIEDKISIMEIELNDFENDTQMDEEFRKQASSIKFSGIKLQNSKNKQYLITLSNDVYDHLIHGIEQTNGMLILLLASDIGFFLCAILLSILSYVYASGLLLFASFYLIGAGVFTIFSVWYFFYQTSNAINELYRLLVVRKATVKQILENVNENSAELTNNLRELYDITSE